MIRLWDWEYHDVPRLGTVIFPPDVVARLMDTPQHAWEVEEALDHGADVRRGNVVGREGNGVRLVIRLWPALPGAAAVCVNGYRVMKP